MRIYAFSGIIFKFDNHCLFCLSTFCPTGFEFFVAIHSISCMKFRRSNPLQPRQFPFGEFQMRCDHMGSSHFSTESNEIIQLISIWFWIQFYAFTHASTPPIATKHHTTYAHTATHCHRLKQDKNNSLRTKSKGISLVDSLKDGDSQAETLCISQVHYSPVERVLWSRMPTHRNHNAYRHAHTRPVYNSVTHFARKTKSYAPPPVAVF